MSASSLIPNNEPRFQVPDARGRFGRFGGLYVPETLMTPLLDLTKAYAEARRDPAFQQEYADMLRDYAGRPTGLYFAESLTKHCGGARIYLKREDMLHTGAHKINNVIGQALLARRLGKKRIIAETGAGQHGTATAAVCARFGLKCVIYMGATDMERQALNVYRMRLMGAEVRGVEAGQRTLKEAVNEAMRDWVTNVRETHYILGTAYGAHPYPMMVRDFHRIISLESKQQMLRAVGRLPDDVVACVGGGSNAIGAFFEYLDEPGVRLTGVEAGGRGIKRGEHAARFAGGRLGVLQGCMTNILMDGEGQIEGTHSVSAGLDYAAVGPEHSYYRERGRIDFAYATDDECLDAFQLLSRTEGIIPALESSHAIAHGCKVAAKGKPGEVVLINLSGRGDKDVWSAARALGTEIKL
ncbi:tryptophan synthase beta chain [Verrucomicrobiota bacterium]|nr:tryptophan synthase beta chain [Verrucomicrobiota bacterium]GDY17459.1 tryptophan synthase beta chain [Verrucomicrobiota bacterium]